MVDCKGPPSSSSRGVLCLNSRRLALWPTHSSLFPVSAACRADTASGLKCQLLQDHRSPAARFRCPHHPRRQPLCRCIHAQFPVQDCLAIAKARRAILHWELYAYAAAEQLPCRVTTIHCSAHAADSRSQLSRVLMGTTSRHGLAAPCRLQMAHDAISTCSL